MIETVLLYLAVAHFGRGRGEWESSECPAFWKDLTQKVLDEQKVDFKEIKEKAQNADQLRGEYSRILNAVLKEIFKDLYNVSI